jgi:hypothetical protein
MREISIIPLTVPAITKGGTLYTSLGDKPLKFERSTGVAAMYLKSTAGQITITQQVSMDGNRWFDAINNAKQPVGNVISGQDVTTGLYITFTPVFAKYIRFKIVENDVAATTVSMTLLSQGIIGG